MSAKHYARKALYYMIRAVFGSIKETHSIYTDLAKAFGSLNFKLLIRKLEFYKMSGPLLNGFAYYHLALELVLMAESLRCPSLLPECHKPQFWVQCSSIFL